MACYKAPGCLAAIQKVPEINNSSSPASDLGQIRSIPRLYSWSDRGAGQDMTARHFRLAAGHVRCHMEAGIACYSRCLALLACCLKQRVSRSLLLFINQPSCILYERCTIINLDAPGFAIKIKISFIIHFLY